MKRRLVYHLWVQNENWFDWVVELHFKCLSHYKDLFDESLFVLSIDDTENNQLIEEIKNKIIEIGFDKNVTFKVEKNDPFLREGATFRNEISRKLEYLDGLTFFAHSKGTSDFNKNFCKKEDLSAWIVSMYFLSLQDINSVDYFLNDSGCLFYGSLPIIASFINNNYGFYYSGSFYWIPCQKVYKFAMDNKIEIPDYSGKYFAEQFPGNICEPHYAASLSSWTYDNYIDFYNLNVDGFIKKTLSEDAYLLYKEFYEKMTK